MPAVAVACHHERPIDPAALRHLYDTAGWWPERAAPAIAAMLEDDLAVGAWDGDRLVGFARAVSDRRFRAYIEDVVVHPEYRRAGIGGRLLDALVDGLAHIDTVSLFCAPELVPFYERQGFRASRSQVVLHRERADPQ